MAFHALSEKNRWQTDFFHVYLFWGRLICRIRYYQKRNPRVDPNSVYRNLVIIVLKNECLRFIMAKRPNPMFSTYRWRAFGHYSPLTSLKQWFTGLRKTHPALFYLPVDAAFNHKMSFTFQHDQFLPLNNWTDLRWSPINLHVIGCTIIRWKNYVWML